MRVDDGVFGRKIIEDRVLVCELTDEEYNAVKKSTLEVWQ